ncbi:MAG TPA: DinB family protein [Verrucomicrobiae bacterium]|nr:DinB family protein [Verrucomicrobiae bacterium]
MMRITTVIFLAAISGSAQTTFDAKMPDMVPKVTGDVVTGPGIHWIDVKIGDGAPATPGAQYTLHYTGWLRDGTKFDSSVDRGEPFTFTQGRREVIAGYDIGFEGMKVGGKRRLFIPYQLAYGETQRGSIPPKSELIFDLELLGVKPAPEAKPAAADLLLPFTEEQDQVLALAKALPEEKYSWRPGPGVRSFREVFLHIAYGNRLLLTISGGAKQEEVTKLVAEQQKKEAEPLTKDQVIQALTDSFAAVKSAFEGLRAQALARDADFFGTATTRRGVLTFLDVHIGEHLGQAIAYARMNGIVPPWSK